MPDLADLAQAQNERVTGIMLTRRLPEAPPASGSCLHCGAPLPRGGRWCDAECRDDWERLDAALRRQGR
jgi:predicted nucleic acid-binding Zn ribbon protein